GLKQLLERITKLQAAQPWGVGRADVNSDVTGVLIDLVQAQQVIIHGVFDRSIEVLADIDAQHTLVFGRLNAGQQVVNAVVVEAHAIDDRLRLRQAKQARLGITRLRTRRHGTDFNKA